MIDQEAEFRQTSPEHETNRLAMKDETNHLFRYLAKIFGKRRSVGISSIEVPFKDNAGNLTDDPTEAVTWIKINDPEDITRRLIARNVQHFGQAKDTAFATSPLQNLFGFRGDTEAAAALIQDRQVPDIDLTTVPAEALLLLHKLADGNNLSLIDDDISCDAFWRGFQKWDEQTSTSPSGRHLGHYKALMMADGADKLYNEKQAINPSWQIKEVYFHIALAATLSGNTLTRWSNSSTMMIEKIPGQPRIHKLRVIHIFEADFNLMLKLLWARRLVWHAHKNNALHESQAGSRPDHRCIDVVLRKTMNYLYSTLTRTPLITIDNDAKACYDRIICNVAMLVSKYFGMTKEACQFHAKTLQQMKFKIRTAAGDSSTTYQHTAATPIHGTGQGSCASPCLWLLISTILLACYASKATGMIQHNVTSKTTPRKVTAETFVDDVAVFINFPTLRIEQLSVLILLANQDIRLWLLILYAAGGKLELDKCFWYLLWWTFNHMGDPRPMTRDEVNAITDDAIIIEDVETKTNVRLAQKEVHEAHRTLGAYKSISGDETTQYEILMEKSNSLALSTRTGQLSRFQARRAFTAIYIPSMTYSLVSTNLSQHELRAIQSKAIQAFLPAMGYERSFPHAVVFASRSTGGLNIGDLYTECGVAKAGAVLEHVRAQTGLGQIMVINLNWLQLHVGIGTPVLETAPTVQFPYVASNWFIHLREFLLKAKGTISIRDLWLPRLEREGDCFLMEKIMLLKIKKRDIRICNNWRLYFQAITLSDIVTADGRFVQDIYWRCSDAGNNQHSNSRRSTLNWPHQQQPHRKTFAIWKKCINLAFNLGNRQQLPIPLGPWMVPPKESNNKWQYYLEPDSLVLYGATARDIYDLHTLSNHANRPSSVLKFRNQPDEQVPCLPESAVPVHVEAIQNILQVRSGFVKRYHSYPGQSNPDPQVSSDFDSHINQLPSWKQQLLLHWETVSSESLVKFLTRSECILVASDGSHNLEKGTGCFGAVIGDDNGTVARISGSVPGRPDLISSFRAEMYGILAVYSLLNEVTSFYKLTHQIRSTSVQTFVDSKSAIARITKHRESSVPLGHMMSTDMDIELQILQEIKDLEMRGYRFRPIKHVKSHQDDHSPFHQLSREAQLNVLADRLASDFDTSDYIWQTYHPPSAVAASLYISGTIITSKYRECLRHEAHLPALQEYMKGKWEWSQDVVDSIWWQPHGSALKRLSHADRQKVQKFNYYHLPTNHRLHKFHSYIDGQCEDCKATDEGDDHIIWCNQTDRLEAKQRWEEDVVHFLSEDHTPPSVRTALLVGFHHWIYQKPVPPLHTVIPTAPDDVKQAFVDQTRIGWNHCLRGRLSIHWKQIIANHVANTSDTKIKTSNEWATGFIISLWHGILILWDIRNRSIHGPNHYTPSPVERKRLLQEAIMLLEIGEKHPQFELEWFKKPLEELEKYSVLSLKAWVRNARTMVRMHQLEVLFKQKEEDMDGDGLSNVNSVDLLRDEEEQLDCGS